MNRPWRNGTYIRFNDATLNGTTVSMYDCGWSPNVIYSGSTIIIHAPYPWVPGHQYYVTFDSGEISDYVGNYFVFYIVKEYPVVLNSVVSTT